MIKCINSKALDEAGGLEGLLGKAAARGFEGLELSFGKQEEAAGEDLAEQMGKWGGGIVVLTTSDFDLFSLAEADGSVRQGAIECFGGLLRMAVGGQESEKQCERMVVIGAYERQEVEGGLRGSYEGAFNRLFLGLEELAGQAEEWGVRLALENPGGGLLLSPLEMRDLIDEINSGYVGICFNPAWAGRLGDRLDWMRIFGQRIFAVRLNFERWDKLKVLEKIDDCYLDVIEKLTKKGFDGPVIYKPGA
ncbi:MAG: TIM barrel protein [Sedimentisphaerales bacterium]|nr:TIM barrel protein [Sedimentisphaerales bacterium]